MLRTLSCANIPVTSLFYRPLRTPQPPHYMQSIMLRILGNFLGSDEHVMHMSSLCCDNECLAEDAITYKLLVAEQLPMIEDRPDVYSALSFILKRYAHCLDGIAPTQTPSHIVMASDLSWGEPNILARLHEFAGQMCDVAFQAEIKNLHPDEPHVVMQLYNSAANLAWGNHLGLRLNDRSYQVVPRDYVDKQNTGAALFFLVVSQPLVRYCIYPTLACMFVSGDVRKVRWCLSTCHYMLKGDLKEALAIQDIVYEDHVEVCTKLFAALLEKENLFILLKEDRDHDHAGTPAVRLP